MMRAALVGAAGLCCLALTACGSGAQPAKPVASASANAPAATTPATPAASSVDTAAAQAAADAWKTPYRGVNLVGVKTTEKIVAITVDDGPNAATKTLVDAAIAHNAKLTFFFIGKRVTDPAQVLYASEHGMEIANHTFTHMPFQGRHSGEIQRGIAMGDDVLEKITGVKPVWVRAWGGIYGPLGKQVLGRMGHLYANWTVDSNDSHQQYLAPSKVYDNVISGVKPGAIILIHQTHPESVEALPRILTWLDDNGYRAVTLSEMAQMGSPVDGGYNPPYTPGK